MPSPHQQHQDASELLVPGAKQGHTQLHLAPVQHTPRDTSCCMPVAAGHPCRYPWPLLQPVLAHMMQEQLAKYEAEEHVEVSQESAAAVLRFAAQQAGMPGQREGAGGCG